MESFAEKMGITVSTDSVDYSINVDGLNEIEEDDVEIYSLLLSELALVYSASSQSHNKALAVLSAMENTLQMDIKTSCDILHRFLETSTALPITECVRRLAVLSGDVNDGDLLTTITSAYVRDIRFVTGSVSMETLPVEDCPEAAFIGRSNVGKSSLINILTTRRELAYTSSKPGKTSEFNYYDARGVLGRDNEAHRFYLVDVPGVGYARKSRDLRDDWTNLLRNFVHNRGTLRVIFHLVDSRHGLLPADEECLSLLVDLPSHVQYVIVLTKVDKLRGIEKEAAQRDMLVDQIYGEVAKRTGRVVPILFTSSETRSGGSTLMATLLEGLNRTV
eukprot:gene23999-30286_t